MQRFWSITFLFLFLSANTAFGEVLKLPILFHHYYEHVVENDEDFSDFIVQHYQKKIDHQHNDNHHDHERLPFKSVDGHCTSPISINLQTTIILSNEDFVEIEPKLTYYFIQHYSDSFLNCIWQPPRSC